MEHNLFKPKTLNEGQHAVVGDCNGFTMQQRWDEETPFFAKKISKYIPKNGLVLDYGCGVGRISKELLKIRSDIKIVGTDASDDMRELAEKYVSSDSFSTVPPHKVCSNVGKFDVVYCIYVLQHVPAIEIRDILYRIYDNLEDSGVFVYCSSDYRMAIRFDGGGFADDRFLGVNLREEISRLFKETGDLFSSDELKESEIVRKMIRDGLEHPAKVYKKKLINKNIKHYDLKSDFLHNTLSTKEENGISGVQLGVDKIETNKILLVNRLAPGDILVMTNAIRDLKASHPDFEIDVRTPCQEIFENNPRITKLHYDENKFNHINNWFQSNGDDMDLKHRVAVMDGITVIDMHYPSIHSSGTSGQHFSEGHRRFLEYLMGIKIHQTSIAPEIFLKQSEKDWVGPVMVKEGYDGKYWAINAGSKGDYTLKQYHRYQEVVDLLKNDIMFVQIGQLDHRHKALDGVIDMRGKTNIRELFRLLYRSDGCITCVSFPMHIMGAFNKPCVVVAGGREPIRWEFYGSQRYLAVNGAIPCAPLDGCWRSTHKDCVNLLDGNIPKCHDMITPEEIARNVRMYYDGGVLKYENKKTINTWRQEKYANV